MAPSPRTTSALPSTTSASWWLRASWTTCWERSAARATSTTWSRCSRPRWLEVFLSCSPSLPLSLFHSFINLSKFYINFLSSCSSKMNSNLVTKVINLHFYNSQNAIKPCFQVQTTPMTSSLPPSRPTRRKTAKSVPKNSGKQSSKTHCKWQDWQIVLADKIFTRCQLKLIEP